jgi:hypothetical protein
MQANELREHADMLLSAIPLVPPSHRGSLTAAADYLRACADALDAGPIAVIHRNEAGQIYMQDADCNAFDISKHIGAKLYHVAMPAPIRMPEPMTRAELDEVLDEYGSGDGVRHCEYELCRGIEADTLRRVKEANE